MDSKSGMLFSDSLYYYVLYSNYGDLGRMNRVLHVIHGYSFIHNWYYYKVIIKNRTNESHGGCTSLF